MMKFTHKTSILSASKLSFLIAKYSGFFPFTINFNPNELKRQVSSDFFDYVLLVISLSFSFAVSLKLEQASLPFNSNSVILETGIFLVVKTSTISSILIKILNYFLKHKFAEIVYDLHWIDLKVKFVVLVIELIYELLYCFCS